MQLYILFNAKGCCLFTAILENLQENLQLFLNSVTIIARILLFASSSKSLNPFNFLSQFIDWSLFKGRYHLNVRHFMQFSAKK